MAKKIVFPDFISNRKNALSVRRCLKDNTICEGRYLTYKQKKNMRYSITVEHFEDNRDFWQKIFYGRISYDGVAKLKNIFRAAIDKPLDEYI